MTEPIARGEASLPPWLRHILRTALHLLLDAAAVALAYRLAFLVRFHWDWWVEKFPITGIVPPWGLYQSILYAVVPLWLLLFWYSSKIYTNPWLTAADRFLQILKGCVLGTGATMVASYIYSRLEYSRLMLLCAGPIALALVSLSHALVLWLDARLSRLEAARPVLLVGGGSVAEEIKKRIRSRHPWACVNQIPDLPTVPDLERQLAKDRVCELILVHAPASRAEILTAAQLCEAYGAAFKMLPDLLELRLGEVQMDFSLGLPAYRIEHSQLNPLNFLAKRIFDVVFSIAVMALCALPFLAACLLIKLDSAGPVFYKQKRYGRRGNVFEVYKFRTMISGAESRITEIKESLGSASSPFFKAKNDPRITRVGAFLRRLSLDEFPQFFNVLRGEMSVVGPRPLALSTGEMENLLKDFGATAKKRLNIFPGITGLWQVSGRSDVSSMERFKLDLFYIEHWSLGLDLEIILKTIPALFSGSGAY